MYSLNSWIRPPPSLQQQNLSALPPPPPTTNTGFLVINYIYAYTRVGEKGDTQ